MQAKSIRIFVLHFAAGMVVGSFLNIRLPLPRKLFKGLRMYVAYASHWGSWSKVGRREVSKIAVEMNFAMKSSSSNSSSRLENLES